MKPSILRLSVLTVLAGGIAQAATIVEPVSGGLLFQNYTYTSGGTNSITATGGTAVGLSGTGRSIYGGTGTQDQYTFRFTPGVDPDNFMPAPGLTLGDNFGVTNYASGLAGGGSGLYDVYATWIASANVTVSNANFSVSSDGPLLTLGPFNQNNGGTGTPGGNAGWFKLGTVALTAGNTYTVVVDDVTTAFVGLRMAGVMWEPAFIPEPSSVGLALLGGLAWAFGAIARRRRG